MCCDRDEGKNKIKEGKEQWESKRKKRNRIKNGDGKETPPHPFFFPFEA